MTKFKGRRRLSVSLDRTCSFFHAFQLNVAFIELPFATLPRWFHANSLIRDRGTSFTFINPREENIPIDPSTQDSEPNEGDARALRVVSDNATWTSTFANGTHVTSSGSVKAVMVPDTALGDLRIRSIVFTLALHDEWILRAALQKGELLDQPADGIMLDLDVAIVKAACASNSSPALSTNNIKLETTPRTETSSLPSVASSKGSVKNRKPKPLSKRQRREQAKREEAEAEARDSEKESADDERRLQEETAQVDLMSLSMRRDTTASKVSSEGMASRQVSSDIAWPFPESRVDEYGITHEAMRYLEVSLDASSDSQVVSDEHCDHSSFRGPCNSKSCLRYVQARI